MVRDYINDFKLDKRSVVLDPFCGTGTTIVEAKLNDIPSVGIEANTFAHFASQVKTNWDIDTNKLLFTSKIIAKKAIRTLEAQCIFDEGVFDQNIENHLLLKLPPVQEKLILTNSISPLPLHKTLVLMDILKEYKNEPFYNHQLLALANALVFTISNLRFGPEVGIGKPKKDAAVIRIWLNQIIEMCNDLEKVSGHPQCKSLVFLADLRQVDKILEPLSIDAIITSPPYPNEKDYTRTTRLEFVILGLINTREELRELKKGLIRSNTRNVYKDDDDSKWIEGFPEIQRIASEIENRRIELGKTSGFERLYSKVTKLYFGGMTRHLESLKTVLRPGAKLAYVVGDQASYLQVMIRTGQILSDISRALGYEVIRTDLFRTRFSTATRKELREEVVVLRWPG